MLISKLGQGVFLAARPIGTGSGVEHAGGTPLPISKASTPPPPPPPLGELPSEKSADSHKIVDTTSHTKVIHLQK